MGPDISIIVPLYNKAKYIEDVLNSIKYQTFQDYEVIVVDDGSTDDSAVIVEQMKDEHIRLIRKINGGVSSARNMGLFNSKGKLIFFLDGDDLIEPTALEILYDLYLRNPACDIFTGNFEIKYPNVSAKKYCKGSDEYVIQDNFKDFYMQKYYLRTGMCLIRKESLIKTDGFNEKLSNGEDLEFFLRLMSFCSIAYTPKVIFKYVKEASYLSKIPVPLEKTILSVINVNKATSYEKKVLLDIIIWGVLTQLQAKRISVSFEILKQYRNNLPSLLVETPHAVYCSVSNSCLLQRLANKLQQ